MEDININEKVEQIKSKKYDEEAVKESLKKVQRYLKKLAGDYKSEDSSIEEIKEEALKEGMHTLRMSATDYVLDGTTSFSEMVKVSFDV